MTNYEWLVKTRNILEFLCDIKVHRCEDVRDKYRIPFRGRGDMDSIVLWLQAEREETKWVRLDQVLRVIGEPAVPLLPKDDKCIKFPDERELYERVNKIIDNRVKKIKALETKEMEDD